MAFKMKASPFNMMKGDPKKKNKRTDFNPKSDTVFVGQSSDMGLSRKKAGMKGNASASKGASGVAVKGEKILQGKYPSGKTRYTTVRKYTKK